MPRPQTEAAEYKGMMVRLPEETLEEFKEWAKEENRSFNAQLVYAMKHLLKQRKGRKKHDLVGSRED